MAHLTRRQALAGGSAALAGLAAPALIAAPARAAAASSAPRVLSITPATLPMLGPDWPETRLWTYGGSLPGPELRLPQGARLQVTARNGLDRPTTVHWHGIRLPNAMDGVPHLTQPPIAPGESFDYAFDLPDAGTYWYHPHFDSSEQVGRGLYGALIVEEDAPIRVDRELVWMLDDWRLTREGQIAEDFGNFHDASHGGRLGNTVTINGRLPGEVALRPGERLRLRLVNTANARIFALDFGKLAPVVIALDGQPVTPHEPEDGVVVLGPAMRADLVLDASLAPGARQVVRDLAYRDAFEVVTLAAGDTPLRAAPPDWDMALPPNPLPEPNMDAAERHEIVFNGGMMGGGMMGGDPNAMMAEMRQGRMWFINGKAAMGHNPEPALTFALGSTQVLAMENATAFPHPIHLHGHSFRVQTRDGQPVPHRPWQDTVLIAPRERVEIAFVADNPGDWMFHCHVLEHQEAGMKAVLRVT